MNKLKSLYVTIKNYPGPVKKFAGIMLEEIGQSHRIAKRLIPGGITEHKFLKCQQDCCLSGIKVWKMKMPVWKKFARSHIYARVNVEMDFPT